LRSNRLHILLVDLIVQGLPLELVDLGIQFRDPLVPDVELLEEEADVGCVLEGSESSSSSAVGCAGEEYLGIVDFDRG
jgi:hypothetical protein